MVWCLIIKLLVITFCMPSSGGTHKLHHKIGGIFSDEKHNEVFRIAAASVNKKYPFFDLKLIPVTTSLVPYQGTLETYQLACELLKLGIIGIFGPSSTFSSCYIQSLLDSKEIPHIEIHRDFNIGRNDSVVNIYPHPEVLSNLFSDIIDAFAWRRFTVIYDTNENLRIVNPLVELNLKKNRVVWLRQLETDGNLNYRPVLTDVKNTGETEFLITCFDGILEEVLKQLQQVGMMTEKYSYLIANLNFQTVDLSPFQFAGTNITGVRIFDPTRYEVIRIQQQIRKGLKDYSYVLNVEAALLFDSIQLFYETLVDLSKEHKKTIEAFPIFCNTTSSWKHGSTITNLMKDVGKEYTYLDGEQLDKLNFQKSIQGLTGLIKFNEGLRKDFTVDILELTTGGLVTISQWNSSMRLINFQRPKKLTTKKAAVENIFNTTFNVLISISHPYGMLKQITKQLEGNDRYEGYGIDVINELSLILGFNYTFILQEDGSYGVHNKTTNEWNGMMREIIDGRADMAITDLTITSERENAVDFTMPFMNLGISILYRKPEPVPPSLFMFISPFSWKVWAMLGVSYLIVSMLFFLMGRISPGEWQNPYPCIDEPQFLVNQFNIRNSLWFTIGALMQQGTELAPNAISTRAASGAWWFFVLIMVSSYTANLAAFLTVETFVTSFKDIEELASQDIIKFGAKKGGATASYFKDSNLSIYQRVWSYMRQHPELMVDDNNDGVRKVETENYAFLMESTTIEYVTERSCGLARVGGLLDDKGYGIAVKKDSPYRNELSSAVLQLQEKGVLTKLKIKWWKEKRGGGKCSSNPDSSEATALGLQNVGGVFLVLSVGTILGLLGSFMELAWTVHRRCKREQLPFRKELLKELRFVLKFNQNVKEIVAQPSDECNSDKKLISSTKYSF